MSLHGELTRIRELLVDLTDRGPKLSGKIEPVKRLQGMVRSDPRFSGVLTVVGRRFTITIRRITQLYRFIRAICTERLHIRVRPVSAKGTVSAAHKRLSVVRGSRPVSGPAVLPMVHWSERMRHSVNPVSRLVGNVFAHIAAVTGHAVDPIAAPCAAASQHRSAQTGQDVVPIPAPGAAASPRMTLRFIRKSFADISAALTASTKTRRMDVKSKAGATCALAEQSNAHACISATDKAKPVSASATQTAAHVAAWCVRRANAASRYIGNLFARCAAVMGRRLTASTATGYASMLHRAAQTAMTASATWAAGKLTRLARAAQIGLNASPDKAAAATADRLTAAAHMGSKAVATTYATYSANATQIINTASDLLPGTAPATTAAAHSVQLMRDRAAAGHWYVPDMDGSTLTVYQMSGGVQTANVLDLDIDYGVYWANAFCADGVLTMVFAADAAQNNDVLEVV